ncbi:MAG: Asp23/Gls24 family envelope stress response protein [Candidatus Acetothermia bacterium]|nr:Asp23/Gls24 family envelope stress response protein [Candidatus Acetothermia bacterium]MDH7505731.1 Asp23/Gls24 family envelope stress response protein [Candidatus Acetothermia bacterium]
MEEPLTRLGQVFISAEALEQLVLGVIGEGNELYPLNWTAGDEGLLEMLAKAYKGSGVEVTRAGEELRVRLQLLSRYGTRIPEAARQLALRLRQRLRELAELEVVDLELEVRGLVTSPGSRSGE